MLINRRLKNRWLNNRRLLHSRLNHRLLNQRSFKQSFVRSGMFHLRACFVVKIDETSMVFTANGASACQIIDRRLKIVG